MALAKKIKEALPKASMIRKMFEEGRNLKKQYGDSNVFDFSLGNPFLNPPEGFLNRLKQVVAEDGRGRHGYLPNAGHPEARKAIAGYVKNEQGVDGLTENDIIITSGAAGGLNVIFKAILDPGDEVITFAPYFVEYNHYVENHGGVLKVVETNDDFSLNIAALNEAITPKTKVVLVNTPNNPTGQIYPKEILDQLGNLLEAKSKEHDRIIYLISDEPYRKIAFDGNSVPSLFASYNNSIMTTSYSKDLSIPGERIGFVVVGPETTYRSDLATGMAVTNRILGFVNASALMQRVIIHTQGLSADMAQYEKKRDLLCDGLESAGYEFQRPAGAFYLFPKSPVPDEFEFVKALKEELILVVPGSSFGRSGYFRIAFCVDDQTVTGAMPGFEKVLKRFS